VVIEHATAPWFSGGLEIDHHVPDRATEQIRQSIRVPRCECKDCRDEIDLQEIYAKEKFGDYHAIIPGAEPELPWHQCMLMSSHMFAFILKDRTYGKSNIL
jgi:hypothetical protein